MTEDEKAKLIMTLIRAEVRYLDANGWTCYIGMGVGDNPDLSYLDEESGQWRTWGEPGHQPKPYGGNGKSLYTQRQAMTIQRAKDGF